MNAQEHDNHVLRATTVGGEFANGDWFGAGAAVDWLLTPRWRVRLSAEHQKLDEIRGDLTVNAPEGRRELKDSASVELETGVVLVAIGFCF